MACFNFNLPPYTRRFIDLIFMLTLYLWLIYLRIFQVAEFFGGPPVPEIGSLDQSTSGRGMLVTSTLIEMDGKQLNADRAIATCT